jgi:hypothetical protein
VIVVTNTSPLLNLAAIGEARLLPALFGRVTAPNMVREEIDSLRLRDHRFQSADIASAASFSAVGDSSRVALLSLHLDPGEAEAIALALELRADLILLDERRATALRVNSDCARSDFSVCCCLPSAKDSSSKFARCSTVWRQKQVFGSPLTFASRCAGPQKSEPRPL